MGYQISDTYDAIDQAMRLLRRAMRGMPERHRYIRHYDDLRKSVAVLLLLLEETAPWMDETREAKQATTRAKQLLAAVR